MGFKIILATMPYLFGESGCSELKSGSNRTFWGGIGLRMQDNDQTMQFFHRIVDCDEVDANVVSGRSGFVYGFIDSSD